MVFKLSNGFSLLVWYFVQHRQIALVQFISTWSVGMYIHKMKRWLMGIYISRDRHDK